MNKHYPKQIRALPRFEGPFEAYKLRFERFPGLKVHLKPINWKPRIARFFLLHILLAQ
jgi:hypothetical protein